MPRFPKPWYRKNRRRWFVQIDGKQVKLGPDRKTAFAHYHALMQQPKKARHVDADSIVALIDAFLERGKTDRPGASSGQRRGTRHNRITPCECSRNPSTAYRGVI